MYTIASLTVPPPSVYVSKKEGAYIVIWQGGCHGIAAMVIGRCRHRVVCIRCWLGGTYTGGVYGVECMGARVPAACPSLAARLIAGPASRNMLSDSTTAPAQLRAKGARRHVTFALLLTSAARTHTKQTEHGRHSDCGSAYTVVPGQCCLYTQRISRAHV